MSRRYGCWPALIRSQYISELDKYASILTGRLLPAFASVAAEAERMEDETYQHLLAQSSEEEPDIASLAQSAAEKAADFLGMMWRMEQAQINLQTVGLYHLFEQRLFELHRRWLLPPDESKATAKIRIEDTKAELLRDRIDIEKFTAWPKVDELRLVTNCAKHAEGSACKFLRNRRPDLLSNPSRQKEGLPFPDPDPVVLNPLAGENLYVSLPDFEEYVKSLKSFWSDLANGLPV